jgi:hypothetical protein
MPKKQKNKMPPAVVLFWQLLNSKAYKDLPPSAAKALPYFLGKVKGVPLQSIERYQIEFTLTYPEAQGLGFSKGTYYKVICDLIVFGFIECAEKGGLRGYCKTNNKFKLSTRWTLYGTPEFIIKHWPQEEPKKTKVTPKYEPYRPKIRTKQPIDTQDISYFGLVGMV